VKKKQTLAKLHNEFVVHVNRDRGMNTISVPLCGLCGNNGIIKTKWHPPWTEMETDYDSYELEGYCICKNGREMRKKAVGSRWGGTSITRVPLGCSPQEEVEEPEKEDENPKDFWDHVKTED